MRKHPGENSSETDPSGPGGYMAVNTRIRLRPLEREDLRFVHH